MPNKYNTLEETIARQEELKAEKLSKNAENIIKIQKRIEEAEGSEKERLSLLLEEHKANRLEMEKIDAVGIATERFNRMKNRTINI